MQEIRELRCAICLMHNDLHDASDCLTNQVWLKRQAQAEVKGLKDDALLLLQPKIPAGIHLYSAASAVGRSNAPLWAGRSCLVVGDVHPPRDLGTFTQPV